MAVGCQAATASGHEERCQNQALKKSILSAGSAPALAAMMAPLPPRPGRAQGKNVLAGRGGSVRRYRIVTLPAERLGSRPGKPGRLETHRVSRGRQAFIRLPGRPPPPGLRGLEQNPAPEEKSVIADKATSALNWQLQDARAICLVFLAVFHEDSFCYTMGTFVSR